MFTGMILIRGGTHLVSFAFDSVALNRLVTTDSVALLRKLMLMTQKFPGFFAIDRGHFFT